MEPVSEQFRWIPFPDRLSAEATVAGGVLGGFLVGAENRLAESVVDWILDGVPRFDDGSPSVESRLKTRTVEKKRASRTASNSIETAAERTNVPFESVPYLLPAFFYGPSGCGKTHLIRGVYQEIRRRDPNCQGIYLTATDFYRSLTDAISRNETFEFREFFARSRIVVVENVEELAGRPLGQDELTILLNRNRFSRTLLILSASEWPTKIAGFSETLTARLIGGTTVPVAYPSPETRRVLIKKMAAALELRLNAATVDYLVENLSPSVGATFGTLKQIKEQSRLESRALSLPFLREIVENRRPSRPTTFEEIAKTTARYFAVRLSDLRGKTRTKTVALARNITIYLARKTTELTLQEIGRRLSKRDHTTILYAYREIDAKKKENAEIQTAIQKITEQLERS